MNPSNRPLNARLEVSPRDRIFLGAIFAAVILSFIIGTAVHNKGIDREGPAREMSLVAPDPLLDEIPVATSDSALSDFTALATAGDNAGKAELVAAGRIYRVPAGTRVTVLSNGFTSCRIRIRDGDHAGQTAFAYNEWVR